MKERRRNSNRPAADVIAGLWAAVPTPMMNDGRIDYAGIHGNARHFGERLNLDGIFCNGLMGENWSLTAEERRRVLEATVDAASGQIPVGVVTSQPSLRDTIELSQHAQRAGAHHVILTKPFGLFSDEEIAKFIKCVAETIDLPIVLFDAPCQPGPFGAKLIERLSEIPSVVAIKGTVGIEETAEIRQRCSTRVVVSDPLEENWLVNLMLYEQTALYADPEPYLYQTESAQPIRDYYEAWRAGKIARAWSLRARLDACRQVYNRWIMGPLRRGRAPNAALKYWCELMNMSGGGVRCPLRPLDLRQRAALRGELQAAGLVADTSSTPH